MRETKTKNPDQPRSSSSGRAALSCPLLVRISCKRSPPPAKSSWGLRRLCALNFPTSSPSYLKGRCSVSEREAGRVCFSFKACCSHEAFRTPHGPKVGVRGEKPQHKMTPAHWGPQTAQPMNLEEGTKSSHLPPGSKASQPPPLPVADGTWEAGVHLGKASPRPGRQRTLSALAEHNHGDPRPASCFPFRRPTPGWWVGSRGFRAASSEPACAPAREVLTPAHPACAILPGPGQQPLAPASMGYTGAAPSAAQPVALGPVPLASGPTSPAWAGDGDAGTCPSALSRWPGAPGSRCGGHRGALRSYATGRARRCPLCREAPGTGQRGNTGWV